MRARLHKTPVIDVKPSYEDEAELGLKDGLSLLGTAILRWFRRNSPFVKKLVTLALEEDAVHLVAFRGNQVVRCSSIPLPPDLVKDGGVSDPPKLAKLVSDFLARNRVGGAKLLWSVGAFHSLTRTIVLPKMPPSALREALMRETGRAMPIALDDTHISWQTLSSVNGRRKMFVLATPRNSLDGVLKALRQAKALRSTLELKPLALARLAVSEQAVIVDVQRQYMDIVIVVHWVPVLFRSTHWEDTLPISNVAEEVLKTVDFYNRNQTQDRLSPEAPLIVTGPSADDPTISDQLAAAVNRSYTPFDIALRASQVFSPRKYAVNLGLALGAPTWKETSRGKGLTLNVLPAAYRPKHGAAEVLAVSVAIPLGLAALFLLYQMGANASLAKAQAKADLDRLQFGITQNRTATKEIFKAELATKDIQTQMDSLQKESRTILGDMGMHTASSELAIRLLPEGTSLESLTQAGRQITIGGRAADYATAVKYVLALEQSGAFSTVTLKNAATPNVEKPEVTFNLEISLR